MRISSHLCLQSSGSHFHICQNFQLVSVIAQRECFFSFLSYYDFDQTNQTAESGVGVPGYQLSLQELVLASSFKASPAVSAISGKQDSIRLIRLLINQINPNYVLVNFKLHSNTRVNNLISIKSKSSWAVLEMSKSNIEPVRIYVNHKTEEKTFLLKYRSESRKIFSAARMPN